MTLRTAFRDVVDTVRHLGDDPAMRVESKDPLYTTYERKVGNVAVTRVNLTGTNGTVNYKLVATASDDESDVRAQIELDPAFKGSDPVLTIVTKGLLLFKSTERRACVYLRSDGSVHATKVSKNGVFGRRNYDPSSFRGRYQAARALRIARDTVTEPLADEAPLMTDPLSDSVHRAWMM